MDTEKKTTEVESVSAAPKRSGTVTSVAMDKTITVTVDTLKTHPKYRKKYLVSKKYLVHAPEGSYKAGDTVTFQECRPMSKRKHHVVVPAAK